MVNCLVSRSVITISRCSKYRTTFALIEGIIIYKGKFNFIDKNMKTRLRKFLSSGNLPCIRATYTCRTIHKKQPVG